MTTEKLQSEKAEREAAIQTLVTRDQELANEIAERNRERSAIKEKFSQQQGALLQLKNLAPEMFEEESAKAEKSAEKSEKQVIDSKDTDKKTK